MTWMTSKIDTPNIRILLKDSANEEDIELYEEILSKYQYEVNTLRTKVIKQLRSLVKDGVVLN